MRRLALLMGLILATPAQAQRVPEFPYRGQWGVTKPSSPKYTAVVLIDAEGRVAVDSANENGKPVRFFGYVKVADGRGVDFVVTNRTQVAHTHCVIQSSEMLHCYTIRDDKSVSDGVILTKVGPGPHRLTRGQ